MKFGKLQDIEHVDFKLPADHSATLPMLQQQEKAKQLQFYIGCTGWSMKEWVGKVYPTGTKTADFLKRYAAQFNTIELNTTHYRIPTPSTIEKWYAESAPDFKFCPKVPQTISHSRNLGMGTGKILAFCEAIQALNEKLGCCFMQLPPYFGKDRLDLLQQFLERFPSNIPLAIEFRHESWFRNLNKGADLFQLLEDQHKSIVITDVAGRRDVLHMRLTHPRAMVRFVGNALHPSDYSRIDAWVDRINQWFSSGLQEIYFFPHEPDNLLAPDLAAYLLGKLKSYDHIAVRGPKIPVEQDSGQQMSLF